MPDIAYLIQQGSSNLWLFIPSAMLLGALHGLEPGHSKTMMAAFIIAVRGSVSQAVLLGLSATVSHTAIVWLVALAGLHFGSQWSAETTEPYFQIASAVLMILIASWMIWRTAHYQSCAKKHGHDHHDHGHHHDHDHPHSHDHEHHDHDHVHGEHCHHDHEEYEDDYTTPLPHYHAPVLDHALKKESAYQDPHELAHANEITRRFAGREVTTMQIILFGLTSGLIPCPASITVLLVCLQLKKMALGALLVLCFSLGLAVTMVAAGTIAALSAKHVSKRWSGFSMLAQRAPYFSGVLIIGIGIFIGISGIQALAH